MTAKDLRDYLKHVPDDTLILGFNDNNLRTLHHINIEPALTVHSVYKQGEFELTERESIGIKTLILH